jgi:hypothetical protein
VTHNKLLLKKISLIALGIVTVVLFLRLVIPPKVSAPMPSDTFPVTVVPVEK